mgnify:FL=1
MRLYLSSFHLGNKPQIFSDLVGEGKKVALILDAGDADAPEIREGRVARQIEELGHIGLSATDLDLRAYFGHMDELRKELLNYDGVWVHGGSAFVLRRAMFDSGFDKVIIDMLHEDKLAYGGYSAGICVLAPSLRGMQFVDPPSQVEKVFDREVVWEGLNILSYTPVPHYQSERPEYAAINDVIEFMKKEGLPYRTLRDGEAIMVKGEADEYFSEAKASLKKENGFRK